MAEDGYISVREAATILRVSPRQVQYHASHGRIRSEKRGRRWVVLEADVHALADELGADERQPVQPTVEMLPDTGPLVDYLREKDHQLMLMSRRIGELEAMLGQRLLPEDTEVLRHQVADERARANAAAAEAAQLREQLRRAQLPWYKRLFNR